MKSVLIALFSLSVILVGCGPSAGIDRAMQSRDGNVVALVLNDRHCLLAGFTIDTKRVQGGYPAALSADGLLLCTSDFFSGPTPWILIVGVADKARDTRARIRDEDWGDNRTLEEIRTNGREVFVWIRHLRSGADDGYRVFNPITGTWSDSSREAWQAVPESLPLKHIQGPGEKGYEITRYTTSSGLVIRSRHSYTEPNEIWLISQGQERLVLREGLLTAAEKRERNTGIWRAWP